MIRRKYVMMGGYAFSEDSDMQKLKNLAKQGWIIDGVALPILSYRFKKGEPQDLEFAIDYQTDVDEDYFNLFKSAGWKHEFSIGNQIHLFSAPEGTKPIYSDKPSEIDRLESMANNLKKPSLYSAIFFGVMMVINIFFAQEIMGLYYGILIFTLLSVIALIFTSMPYIGYQYRLGKLKRQNPSSKR